MPTNQLKCTCGCHFFRRLYPAAGTWEQLISITDGKVEIEESFTDSIKYGGVPKTIRCADCKKRYPNPDYKGAKQ